MSTLEQCRDALGSANVQAFLRVIRAGESSQDDDAYRTLVGGGRFDSFDDHPRQRIWIGALKVWSTAAGAYQFLAGTWHECAKALSLPDFSPPMQDLAAVFLVKRRGALDDVLAGRIEAAITKCAKEWASLPGSPYGQPVRTMAQALATYAQYGGTLAASPTTPEKPMLPFIAAALPMLLNAAPALIRAFGDSPQAEKNAKAAEVVAGIAQSVTGEPTVEGAVKAIEADPVKAAAYREEVHKSMTSGELLQVLIAAGEADDKSRGLALDRNIQLATATGGKWLWLLGGIAVLVVLFSYSITVGVMFSSQSTFSDETKALLLGQIVIFGFGTVLAFLFGSNIQNRIADNKADSKKQDA